MVPDLNYEYHTITIDSNGQATNAFTGFLEIPLKNVVEARLLASRIHTLQTNEHIYISIDELDSNFNDRATPVLNGTGTIGKVKGVFASLISDVTNGVVNFKCDYNVSTQYINPIRRVDRFTVNVYDQDGNPLPPDAGNTPNYLVIKFTCLKGNL